MSVQKNTYLNPYYIPLRKTVLRYKTLRIKHKKLSSLLRAGKFILEEAHRTLNTKLKNWYIMFHQYDKLIKSCHLENKKKSHSEQIFAIYISNPGLYLDINHSST